MPHLIKRSNKKLIVMGDTIEYLKYEKPYFYNRPPTSRKAFHYIDEKKKVDRRDDNLLQARKSLKRLIESNVNQYNQKSLFVTFTFASNIDDPSVANPEWSAFARRFNTFLKFKAKYATVIEFQKRGAVHYHVLYFNIPFISDLKLHLARIWALGFVKMNAIHNVKSISSYISKYLQKGMIDKRLLHRKAYFTSRNLYKPLIFRNELEIPSILQDLNEDRIVKSSVTENYLTSKYGLVELEQIIREKHSNGYSN